MVLDMMCTKEYVVPKESKPMPETPPDTATMTIRLPSALRERLENLASATHRSRSFLAVNAIEKYVSLEEWQVAGIQKAMEDDRPGIPDEQIAAWIESIGTDKPLPLPKAPTRKKARPG